MSKNQIVTRSVDFAPVEDAGAVDDGRTLRGYGAVFGAATRINNYEGDFMESIAPGAFRKTLQERTPIMQYDHGKDARVGSVPIASIEKINEDGQGLYVEARMFDNPVVEPIRQAIAGKAISGMSFNFRVLRDEWKDGRGIALRPEELGRLLFGAGERGPLQRTLKEVQLYEVGPVSKPAYPQTSVGVRSRSDMTEDDRAVMVADYLRTAFTPHELAAYVADPGSTPQTPPGPDGPPVPNPLPGDKSVRDEADPQTPAGPAGPATPSPLPGDKAVIDGIVSDIAAMLYERKAAKGEPYGDDVEYADPGYQADKKKRYPVDTAEHVRAGWAYINVAKNADKYSAADLAKVKAKIAAAAKKFGITVAESKADDGPALTRTYADPGFLPDKRKRYPLDSAQACQAAWDSIHSTAGYKYKSHQRRLIKDAINAAAARFDVKLKLPEKSNSASDADAALRGTSATGNNDDAAQRGTSSEHEDNNTSRKAVPMPKSIDELRSRSEEIAARMVELGSDLTRSLDEAEQTEFDELHAEDMRISAEIEKIEERAETLKRFAARTPAATEAGSDRAPAFIPEREISWDLAAIRSESRSDEDYAKRLKDNAYRAIEKADYSGDDAEAAQTKVDGLIRKVLKGEKEKLALAERIAATGDPAYERAWGKMVMAGNSNVWLTDEERNAVSRAQSVGTNSAGGFAVPFQLDPTVMLDNAGTINPIRQLARVETIVGKQWQGVATTGVTVTRGAEGSTVGDNSFALTQPVVSTNNVKGFVPFSYEIDLEWGALRSTIAALLMDGKAREEDSFLTGDGTGTNPGGVVATIAAGNQYQTATTATFAAADLYTLEQSLAPRWRSKGQFIANKAFYQAIRQFDTAGGSQLWQRVGAGMPAELLGYPSHEASAVSSNLTTTGQKVAVFGDFSNFLIVDRIGMSMELIPQIFDASNSNRPTGQRGVFAIWMNNSVVLLSDGFALLKIK